MNVLSLVTAVLSMILDHVVVVDKKQVVDKKKIVALFKLLIELFHYNDIFSLKFSNNF